MTMVENGNMQMEDDIVDQYSDDNVARIWDGYIGDQQTRTENYRRFLVDLLKERGCKTVLDVACGTGIDSVMLLEEGFKVTSIDASDKMLKYALKKRWERRREKAFDEWTIEEANWLTLPNDIKRIIGNGFDAVICLGNSFAHLPDTTGDQHHIRLALKNFERCVKNGGILIIDHRNFDQMLELGYIPSNPLYYNSDHRTEVAYVSYMNGQPNSVVLDFTLDFSRAQSIIERDNPKKTKNVKSSFRMSFYPHRLRSFSKMLEETFEPKCKHTIYGDFKQIEETDIPGFYIHFMEKPRQ